MSTKYNDIIGSNIRYERQRRGLTIEELSDILDIAPGFLGLIERGKRGTNIGNLVKIADFFSISLDTLITQCIYNPEGYSVKEEGKPTPDKQCTAVSYINSLNGYELDFIIGSMKNLKKLNKGTYKTNDAQKNHKHPVIIV